MKLIDQILRKPLYVAFGQALQGGGITSVDLVAVRDATTVTMTASDGSAAPIAGADASTAGVMTAADKTKLDGLLAATTQGFQSKPDAAAAVIDAGVSHVRTTGYSTANDGGAALYKRVGAAPAHNLKFQSADLGWWELVPDSHGYINVKQAGAVGDNAANDGQAFIDALDFARLKTGSGLAATHGVIVPPSDTPYYLGANTLELKATVHLVGQGAGQAGRNPCELRWDANVTGIIVHRADTIGATTETDPLAYGADGSKIEGLHLTSGGGTIAGVTDSTKGHGIWLRARAALIDMVITDFPGNGVNIVASSGGAADVQGNANNWAIDRMRISGCHLNGVFVDLADVNAGMGQNIDAVQCGRWGILDSSFLGNTYIGCHVASCGVATVGENGVNGSSYVHRGGRLYAANAVTATEATLVSTTPGTDETVWMDIEAGAPAGGQPEWLASQPVGTYFLGGPYGSDNINAANVFTGCYRESGQGPSQWVFPTHVYGGFVGNHKGTAIVMKGREFIGQFEWPNHLRFDTPRDATLVINNSPDKLLTGLADGDHSAGVNFIAWDNVNGDWLVGEHANLASGRPMRFSTNLSLSKFGRASAVPGGNVSFFKGIFVGSDARHLDNGAAAPSSGERGRGDRVWNKNPTLGGVDMWICRTAGSPGTWDKTYLVGDIAGNKGGRLRANSTETATEWVAGPKAGTDTIADTAATAAVAFATAYASANYAVALSADGDERVWVTAKTATGFTLNRAATSGARSIDWTATPHEDL